MSIYTGNELKQFKSNDAWVKLLGFIPPKVRVLDIGCSSGHFGAALKEKQGNYVAGIDIDQPDITLASKVLDKTYLLNIEKDSVKHLGKFDVIILADVIEHLVNPVTALKKIKQLLAPDGKIVFSIPNMANVTVRVELLKGRFEYKDFGLLDRTHLHFYDKKEVESVFIRAGYQIEKTDCTLREIPDKILIKDLAEVGIKITPKLKKHLNSEEAIIYQFIGSARPSAKPTAFKPQTSSHLDSVSRQIDKLETEHRSVLDQKDSEIKRLTEELKQQKEILNSIYESKSWKLARKLSSIKNKITTKRDR